MRPMTSSNWSSKLRIRFPEIRPGMNVIDHQLDIVAVNVVVEAASDGMDAVVALLPRVQIFPPDRQLKLLRDQEIGCRYIVPACCEVGEPWGHTVHRTTVDIFLEIFTD